MENENIFGIIYVALSSTTNKVYIGQTILGLEHRRNKHISRAYNKSPKNKAYNTHFSNAIRKYGKDDFAWSVIRSYVSRLNLNQIEIKCIRLYNSFYSGYNSTPGGNQHALTQEVKDKISKKLIGRKLPQSTCDKMSKAQKGRTHTEESIAKMSDAHSGKVISKEHRKNISIARVGLVHNDETREKISKSQSGKVLSKEHKNKMSKPKLKIETVKEIRAKHKTGNYTRNQLSASYNVGKSTIRRIVTNLSWKE